MKASLFVCLFLLAGCTYRSDLFSFDPEPQPLIPPVIETPPPVLVPTPILAPQTPAVADTTLPVPQASLTDGTYFFGTTLTFSLGEGSGPGAQVEWSVDQGNQWLTNPEITLQRPVNLRIRTRMGEKLSRERQYTYQIKYRKVFIIGNSILQNQPLPSQGWLGHWGMAATAPDRDFASLLGQKLIQLNPSVEIKKLNAAVYENQFWRFDLSIWKEIQTFQPDLVILRLGDNVEDQRAATEGFRTYLRQLLFFFMGPPPHKARLICTSSFYPKDVVNFEMAKALDPPVSATWVPIMHLHRLPGMTAVELYSDPDIGSHPSDLGMRAIADSIWAGLGPHIK